MYEFDLIVNKHPQNSMHRNINAGERNRKQEERGEV